MEKRNYLKLILIKKDFLEEKEVESPVIILKLDIYDD